MDLDLVCTSISALDEKQIRDAVMVKVSEEKVAILILTLRESSSSLEDELLEIGFPRENMNFNCISAGVFPLDEEHIGNIVAIKIPCQEIAVPVLVLR